jgi:hypothetical protein
MTLYSTSGLTTTACTVCANKRVTVRLRYVFVKQLPVTYSISSHLAPRHPTMALSSVASAALRSVISTFIAHTWINALLLSSLNPLRCSYWNQSKCSADEYWICNWLAFAHLHVAILLSCLMVKADPEFIEKVAYLCCAIIMCYIMEGIVMIDLLNRYLSAIQCFAFIGILAAIAYITYHEPNPMQTLVSRPVLKKVISNPRLDMSKHNVPIATIALIMQSISSLLRVIDMTYGNGREGYKGDTSSPIYQSISNFAVCDMMLACFLLLFGLRFREAEHHKFILGGQALVLFITQVMLATWQGEQMDGDMALAGSIGTFFFVLVAIVGALS